MLQGTGERRLKGMRPEGFFQADTGVEVTGSTSQSVDGETGKKHQGDMRVKSPKGFRHVEAIVFTFEQPIGQEHVRCKGPPDRHGILGIGGYAYFVSTTRQDLVHDSERPYFILDE
jgi:hypothetical protein